MNADDFRQALHADAAHQPPISPDLRANVDRQVRRQRLRAIAVASPAVVVLLLAAALLLPRGGQETTLSVADGGTGTTVTTAVPPSVVTSIADPSTSEPTTTETAVDATSTVPDATTPTSPATTAAPGTSVSCGTVEIASLDPTSIPKGDDSPFACFIKSFNGGVQTDLTIVVTDANGGRLTERISASPDHLLTVEAHGSMTIKLPPFNFGGGGGGLVPDDSDAGGNCGTITVDLAEMGGWGTKDDPANMQPEAKVFKCMFSAITGSGSAHVDFVVHDGRGGTMTSAMDLRGSDHVLTVTMDGTATVKLPDHLKVPEDVLNAMPSGHLGLNGMMQGMGGTWGGWPGKGEAEDKTDK